METNAGGRTYFLYDGIVPVLELDSNAAITATNTFGAAGLSSRRAANTSVFYSFDSEGNVSQRSDASGTVLTNHFFSAHGSILSGALSDPFGYKAQLGYYTDVETGLQLLTYRYYDFQRGRFLTRDPIGYYGGINIYSYTNNNPTNASDPLGLWVIITFDRLGARLWVYDNDHPEKSFYIKNVFSGNGQCTNDPQCENTVDIGPAPGGEYLIGTLGAFGGPNHNRYPGFPLYRFDPERKLHTHQKVGGREGGFYLHPGRASNGCITVWSDISREQSGYPRSADFDRLRDLLNNTSPLYQPNSKGQMQKYTGWLIVQ